MTAIQLFCYTSDGANCPQKTLGFWKSETSSTTHNIETIIFEFPQKLYSWKHPILLEFMFFLGKCYSLIMTGSSPNEVF